MRSFSKLLFGNVGGQLINAVGTIYLISIYTTDAISDFSTIYGIVYAMMSLMGLKSDMFIATAENQHIAANRFVYALSVGGILCFTLYLMFTLIYKTQTANVEMLVLAVFFGYTQFPLYQYLLRKKKFGLVSILKFATPIGILISQITFKSMDQGLLFGIVLGLGVHTLFSIIIVLRNFNLISIDTLFFVHKHRDIKKFRTFTFPEELVNNVSIYAPIILLPFFLDAQQSALAFVAFRIISGPSNIVSSALNQYLYATQSQVGRAAQEQNFVNIVQLIERGLLSLLFAIFVCYIVFQQSMHYILIDQRTIIECILVLSLGIAVRTSVSPTASFFYLLNAHKELFFLSVLGLFRTLAIYIVLNIFPELVIYVWSLIMAVFYLGIKLILDIKLKRPIFATFTIFTFIVFVAAIMKFNDIGVIT